MPLPEEPRTVKPRKPTRHPWLPIIVADRERRTFYCEMTGSFHGWNEAAILFRSHPSAIIVAPGAAHLLAELDIAYADNSMWQYRVSPVKRETYSADPTRRRRRTADTIVNYFGWKGSSYVNGNGKQANRKGFWHYPLDPTLFSSAPIRDLIGDTGTMDLLAWGQDVRAWCHENLLHPSPTAGGLGGQLLRDPRFYPSARRKVPRATNARARIVLPGNHYRLLWPLHAPVDATYLDMSASHHNASMNIQFPCANHLYARGNFRTTDTDDTTVSYKRLWAPTGSPRCNQLLGSYGLLYVQLNVPALKPTQFPPPYMEHAGRRRAWVYSNELPLIRELGADIEGIEAAWTSYALDTGLNAFAAWALAEIATMNPARKRWAKTVLLATYGNLAAKARVQEFAYRTANGGVPVEYPAGPHVIAAHAHVSDIEREIPTVNVIHRGMIEAEQRRITLDFARELTTMGHTVLSIYADAVIVKAGTALPLLPPPWRIDAHLTRLRFASPTAFHSAERSKLPGIAREDHERFRRIASIRRRDSIESGP